MMRIIKKLLFTLSITFFSFLFGNPFLIDFPEKTQLTTEDYLEIQENLQSINLSSIIEDFYPQEISPIQYSRKDKFEYRMNVGIGAVLIDEKRKLYPQIIFEKIGNGGNRCVVSYASYNGKYPELLKDILSALVSTNFNGYFYARIGGYPSPTGKEAKYAAIPYGFKIPMILEAFELGFENVLWLDSSCLPLEDCSSVFSIIEKNSCFFVGGKNCYENNWIRFFFPKAKEALRACYDRDPLLERQLSGSIFGFKKNDPKTQKFVNEYYRLLEFGEVFGSELSEMFVFASIAGYVGYPKEAYIDPYSDELPKPVYAYTKEDQPELTDYERRGIFLYRRQNKPH